MAARPARDHERARRGRDARDAPRLRLRASIDEKQLALRREAMFRLLEGLEIIEITRPVLTRAAQPFPTVLGPLDAIHLASALLWREQTDRLTMATRDAALGLAARACGLEVIGA